MKILFAAAGGEGHLGPLLPFAAAALKAGNEVVVVVPPAQAQTLRAVGLRPQLTASVDEHQLRRVRAAMSSGDRGSRIHAAEVDLFGHLHTMAALPTMELTAAKFQPNLVLREPCDYASAIVAVRHGVSMASVGISPGLADVSGTRLASEVVEPLASGVTAAIESAPYLTRFPTGAASGFSDTRHYGFSVPVSEQPHADTPLAWLTMGTVNSGFEEGRRNWEVALAAVAELPIRVLASFGHGFPIPATPANVEPVEWVELSDILSRASLVICHGGSGTTLAALGAGVPLVIIPLLADQPSNALLVEQLGSGVAIVPFNTDGVNSLSMPDVPRLKAAITSVLTDETYRDAARRASAEFAMAPSVQTRLNEFR